MSPTPEHHRTSSSDSVLHDAKRVKLDDEPKTNQRAPSAQEHPTDHVHAGLDQGEPLNLEQPPENARDTDVERHSALEEPSGEAAETKTMAVRFPSTIAHPEAFVKMFKAFPGELRNRIYDLVIARMLPFRALDVFTCRFHQRDPLLGPGAMANLCHHRMPRYWMKWRARLLERFSNCCLRSLSHGIRNEFLGRLWKVVGLTFCSCDTHRSDGLQVTWKQTTKLGYVFTHSYLHNIVYDVHYRGLRDSHLGRFKEFCQMLVEIAFKGNLIVTGMRFDTDFTTQIFDLFSTKWHEGITIEDSSTSRFPDEIVEAICIYQDKCRVYGRTDINRLAELNELIHPGDADHVCLLKRIDFRTQAFNGQKYDIISYADLCNTEDVEDKSMAIDNPWEPWVDFKNDSVDNPWDLWDDFEDGDINYMWDLRDSLEHIGGILTLGWNRKRSLRHADDLD